MKKSIIYLIIVILLLPPTSYAAWDGAPLVKNTSKGIVIQDSSLHQVHVGNYYRACHRYLDVADGDNATYLIKTDDSHKVYLNFFLGAAGNAFAFFYEDPTISDNGTERIPSNFNRNSSNKATARIFHNATITDNGDFLCGQAVFGGQKNKTTGSSAGFTEWVLKPNMTYLIKFINDAGTVADLFIATEWFEKLSE